MCRNQYEQKPTTGKPVKETKKPVESSVKSTPKTSDASAVLPLLTTGLSSMELHLEQCLNAVNSSFRRSLAFIRKGFFLYLIYWNFFPFESNIFSWVFF